MVVAVAGVLFGGIAALPVSLLYLFTLGLILDTPFIAGLLLLARAGRKLFSLEQMQEFDARRY